MEANKFKKILSYPYYAMSVLVKMSDEEIIEHFKDGFIEVPVKATGTKLVYDFLVHGNSTTSMLTLVSLERFGEPLISFRLNAMGGSSHWSPSPGNGLIFFDTPEVVFEPPDILGLFQWSLVFQDIETRQNFHLSNVTGLTAVS